MKRVLAAGAAILALAGPLRAADLPQPPPPQAPVAYTPVVAPVYNWGGIYYGINGGYGFGKSAWTNPVFGAGSTGNFNTSGFAVGGTLGANYQVQAFVFGVEGDIDWMGIQGTTGVCVIACETRNTWLGTYRGRIGYALDRVLFYGTGGGVYGNVQAGPSGGPFTNTNKAGWTAGAGVEAAFADSWTARVEYLFVDFQNATPFPATTVKLNENLIRFGLDYKFR